MKILALDPATKCGWAHSDGDSGTWDLSTKRDESAGMRLVRFKSHLAASMPFDVIYFEAARHAAPKMQGALVVQAEIQGVLKEFCESRGIEYHGVSPSQVKKIATGKGNAPKPAVVAAAKRKWPDFAGDDNEADARWILELARKELVL